MSVSITHRQKIRGLSLVEVMVAITISLILMAGAITLFVNNKVTYQVNDNLSRLQENARFAVDFMIHDLRMAGYFGCNNSIDKVTNTFVDDAITDESSDLGATISPLEGFNETLGSWSPSEDDVTSMQGLVANTDAITVRHLTGANTVVLDGNIGVLTVADLSTFAEDDAVAVSDCGGTDIFQIDTLAGDTITPVSTLSREYDTTGVATDPENPIVSTLVAIRYYIGDDGDGPSLFREVIRNGDAQVERLIEGVESMHILYGVDDDADNVPDSYVQAGDALLSTVAQWESVVAVRIAMLLRTAEEYGQDIDANQYQLNDFTVNAANDRFKRRVFNTTVLLRNRLT